MNKGNGPYGGWAYNDPQVLLGNAPYVNVIGRYECLNPPSQVAAAIRWPAVDLDEMKEKIIESMKADARNTKLRSLMRAKHKMRAKP